MATDIYRDIVGPDEGGAANRHSRRALKQPGDEGVRLFSALLNQDRTDSTGENDPRVGAVRVRGLGKKFGDREIIRNLDLDIEPGEFVVLLGASGCGKSTLLRILADLDRDISGSVVVATRRAVSFQSPRLMPWKKVWRNVVLGLPGKPDRARAEAALAEVGMTHRSDVWPKVLSGGEAQRASLARALVREPDLLLLDEPFSALDALTRLTAQALVADLWALHQCAVLLVTHDVEESIKLADRVLVMRDGIIAHEARVELPRPRDVTDPAFVALRAELLGHLGVQVRRSTASASVTVH